MSLAGTGWARRGLPQDLKGGCTQWLGFITHVKTKFSSQLHQKAILWSNFYKLTLCLRKCLSMFLKTYKYIHYSVCKYENGKWSPNIYIYKNRIVIKWINEWINEYTLNFLKNETDKTRSKQWIVNTQMLSNM